MIGKNILLCFDAFGTLFKPRQPIHVQYSEVARKYGIDNFTEDQLKSSFRHAFKQQLQEHPNYGRATGMGTRKWWTGVVEQTVSPFLTSDKSHLPPTLAPALIHRFRGKEGYSMFPDANKLLQTFAGAEFQQNRFRRLDKLQAGQDPERRLVVGLISNFDDRVFDILPSLGVRLKPLRHRCHVTQFHPTDSAADVDFAVISYDVGHEKPDGRIFDAAEELVTEMLSAEGDADPSLAGWRKIYVGDEPEKDVLGAVDAGWDAVLIDRTDDGDLNARSSTQMDHLTDNGRVTVVDNLDQLPRILD